MEGEGILRKGRGRRQEEQLENEEQEDARLDHRRHPFRPLHVVLQMTMDRMTAERKTQMIRRIMRVVMVLTWRFLSMVGCNGDKSGQKCWTEWTNGEKERERNNCQTM